MTLYVCPRCKNKSLNVKESNSKVQGVCSYCNYKFTRNKSQLSAMISTFNEYAIIISIISLLLIALVFSNLSSQDTTIVDKLNSMIEEFGDDIEDLQEVDDDIEGDIDSHGFHIVNLQNRTSILETNLTNATREIFDFINTTNSTIQHLYNLLGQTIDYEYANLTLTCYANQTATDGKYNALLDLEIISNDPFNDLTFFVGSHLCDIYAYKNYSYVGNFVTIVEYYGNDTYNSSLKLSGFGRADYVQCSLYIIWSEDDYNSSIFDIDNLTYLLKLNNLYLKNINQREMTV